MKGQPCTSRDTVLSQMGMLSLTEAGCGVCIRAMHVASGLLRLGAWGFSVSVSEATPLKSVVIAE